MFAQIGRGSNKKRGGKLTRANTTNLSLRLSFSSTITVPDSFPGYLLHHTQPSAPIAAHSLGHGQLVMEEHFW
jgi:hypothetical protein